MDLSNYEDTVMGRFINYLLQEGMGAITVSKIGKEWDKHFIESMDVESLLLDEICSDICNLVNSIDLDCFKEYIDYVYAELASKRYFHLYSKHYFAVVTIKEILL